MTLYTHQQKIIDADPKKCGLWLGTGSGKTRIALLLAKGKTIVVCPKTQKLDKSWEREYNKLGLTYILHVVSKEEFKKRHKEVDRYETVILDEVHTMAGVTPQLKWRNKVASPKTSQIFEALQSFIGRTNPSRLYLLTATPVRSPMVVWGLARLLGKTYNFSEFREAFYFQLPIGRQVFAPRKDSETKYRIAKIVKSLGYTGQLSDWFDVPDQTFKTVYVELNAEQKSRIKELKLEYPDPLVNLGKTHQVENGSLLGDEYTETQLFPNEKIDKILDYAAEFPKMIVFAKYSVQIAEIWRSLKKAGYDSLMLTGQTKDRESVIKYTNEHDCILIAQCSVSSGWEVPTCPVVVFASMSYSVVDRVQAEGRIHRANHLKKNLFITLVVKGGIDEHVTKSIENKQDFNERIFVEQHATRS